ncbi:MAG: hypothetical protein ACREM2_09615, partial [Vulcanimicrobiaceae bacterium]
RTARSAAERRRLVARRARYRGLVRLLATIALGTLAITGYLWTLADVTKLNYALDEARGVRGRLLDEDLRLQDRLARLESRERLATIAARLGMHDAASFVAIRLPPPRRAPAERGLAFLEWLR